MASTVACIAMSGVRSSCATSLVRRCSNLMSRSSSVAMPSNVSPSWPISSVPFRPVRAVRSPFLICVAVAVIFLMGRVRARDV